MYLALDYGKKKVGLAAGERIAFSRGYFENDQKLIPRLVELLQEEAIHTVVIGIPVKDSGQEGELGKEIREFADRLKKDTGVMIVFENENDTTFSSHEKLKAAGIGIMDSKKEVDGLAAATILEQYLRHKDD